MENPAEPVLRGAAAKVGQQVNIDIRSPLRDNNSSGYAGVVPSLSAIVPTVSVAATSRLNQLTQRINSDYNRAGEAMTERASVMQQKMKEVGGRIAKTKQQEDDRLKPLYVLLGRAGDDLEKEGALIQAIDQRLDTEMHDMKTRQSDEIEWLMEPSRGQAPSELSDRDCL